MEIEKALHKLQTGPWAKDDATKQEVLNELRGLGSGVLEHVLTLCRSNLWRDRRQGYRLLGGFGAIGAIWLLEDEKAEDLLIGALQNEAEADRVEAIHSLLLIEEAKKTGKSITAVINVLKNDKNPNIRADTAMCLAFIRWDPKVTEALIEALNDNESTKSESFLMGTHYGMSVAAVAAAMGPMPWSSMKDSSIYTDKTNNYGSIEDPAGTILIIESDCKLGYAPLANFIPDAASHPISLQTYGVMAVHNGQANAAFCDGHAKSLSKQAVISKIGMWTSKAGD